MGDGITIYHNHRSNKSLCQSSSALIALSHGMQIAYVVKYAKKWEVDPARTASEFDDEYYRRLLFGMRRILKSVHHAILHQLAVLLSSFLTLNPADLLSPQPHAQVSWDIAVLESCLPLQSHPHGRLHRLRP